MTTIEPELGRRERNKAEKADRIVDAAEALFAERGFEATTTSEIARRADVAAGTVFRYAPTKGSLLLMVFNRHFAAALADGIRGARRKRSATAAIETLASSLLNVAWEYSDNALHYQREVLFGAPDDEHRNVAISMVNEFHQAVAHHLMATTERPDERDAERALDAGRAVFAAVLLNVVASASGESTHDDATRRLDAQVGLIVAGYDALR